MPAGYYRLVYNGFYRGGDITPAALTRRDSTEEVLNAEVYLEGKESKWNNKLASIFDNVQEYKYTVAIKYCRILCSRTNIKICCTIVLSMMLPVQRLLLKMENMKVTSVSV